jgi:hypothetical protein
MNRLQRTPNDDADDFQQDNRRFRLPRTIDMRPIVPIATSRTTMPAAATSRRSSTTIAAAVAPACTERAMVAPSTPPQPVPSPEDELLSYYRTLPPVKEYLLVHGLSICCPEWQCLNNLRDLGHRMATLAARRMWTQAYKEHIYLDFARTAPSPSSVIMQPIITWQMFTLKGFLKACPPNKTGRPLREKLLFFIV